MTLTIVDRVDGYHDISLAEANDLLARAHYLGPTRHAAVVRGQLAAGELVALQTWRKPAARHLPADGSWLELSRWCLTPAAGPNAGSRMHADTVRWLRHNRPDVTTLVSYSDPAAGHTGALYRACNWLWAPTWHRLRPPPTGHGNWTAARPAEGVKDRWVFPVRADARRAARQPRPHRRRMAPHPERQPMTTEPRDHTPTTLDEAFARMAGGPPAVRALRRRHVRVAVADVAGIIITATLAAGIVAATILGLIWLAGRIL